MANRKIKHILATELGSSTRETLDVYDIDALHVNSIYNGLDKTDSGFALDARQGKYLNESITSSVSSLSSSINTISSSVASLQNNIDKLALKRRFILIGDSYGKGVVGDGSLVNGWTYYFKNMSKLTDNDCAISVFNGSGFLGLVSTTFLDLLKGVSVTDPSTITDIVVAGGANDGDVNTSGDLGAAIWNFYNYASSHYPKAKVWVCFCGCDRTLNSNKRAYLKNAKAQYNINTCLVPITPADFFMNTSSGYYGADNVHFNQNGYKALGEWIYAGVMGGSRPKSESIHVSRNFGEALNGCTMSGTVRFRLFDDTLEWYTSSDFSVTFGSTKPTAGSPFNICKMPYPFFGDPSPYVCVWTTYGNVRFSNSGYKTIPLTLGISGGNLQVNIWNADGSGLTNLSNVLSIAFAPDVYRIPLEYLV